MSNTYYDMTGVLALKKVTPVIFALFGHLELDDTRPGPGFAYIAQLADITQTSWESVLSEGIQDLVTELADKHPDEPGLQAALEDDDQKQLLWALAAHFGQEKQTAFTSMMETIDLIDSDIDPKDLYFLATLFDDGHGLSGLNTEGSWHCDRPELSQFGGAGTYLSRHCLVEINSQSAGNLGKKLDEALAGNDLNAAAEIIRKDVVEDLLAGIHSKENADLVRSLLANALLDNA